MAAPNKHLAQEVNPDTGRKVIKPASATRILKHKRDGLRQQDAVAKMDGLGIQHIRGTGTMTATCGPKARCRSTQQVTG